MKVILIRIFTYFFLTTLFFFNSLNFTNASNQDSIRQTIKEATNPIEKIILLNKASQLMQASSTKDAISFAKEALKASEHYKYNKGIVESYISLGNAYFNAKENDKALKSYILAKIYANKENTNNLLIPVYLRLAWYYLNLKEITNALYYNDMAFALLIKERNVRQLSYCYSIYSNCYFEQKDYKKTAEYKGKSIALNRSNSLNTVKMDKFSYNNLGYVYWSDSLFDVALKYYGLYLLESIKDKDYVNVAIAYNNIGSTYRSLGKYEEAIKYLNKSAVLKQPSLEHSYIEIAHCYLTIDLSKSEEYFLLASKEPNVNYSDLLICCNDLIMAFRKNDNREKTDYYYKIKDKINENLLEQTKKTFEVSQIARREATEEWGEGKISNENLQQRIKATNQRDIAIGIIVVLFVILLIASGIFYYHYKKRKALHYLEKMEEGIQMQIEKNKENKNKPKHQ